MDPISAAIVTALAAGVAGGVGEAGKKLMVDAYDALKAALRQKCGVDSEVVEAVEKLEKKPDSAGRQGTLQEEVEAAKAADDTELKQLAQALLKALKDTPEGQAAMSKYNVTAENIGVVGDNAHVEGGIHFK
jgi:hypothetical protein